MYGERYTKLTGGFIKVEETTKRPIQGALFINPRAIPDGVQDHNTTESAFFWQVVHEMIHMLGVRRDNFKNYHKKGSTKLAGDNAVCTMTSYGIKRSLF